MKLDNAEMPKKERWRCPKRNEKTYTKEFKLSAVYLLMGKGYPPKKVFRMLDVD